MSSTAEKQRDNEGLLAINAALETENSELKYQVDKLNHELKLLRIARFGQKSERFNPDQLDLFADAELPPIEAPPEEEAEKEEITYTRKKPKRRNLQEISASGKYPTEQVIHDIDEKDKQCGECDKALSVIGDDKTYMLDRIPAQIKIVEHVKLKYACKCCEGNVKMAKLPKFPIAKSIAMPSLLAYTLVAKYCDHLPLYRQAAMWQREGFDINRSTLSSWVIKLDKVCSPLIPHLQECILNGLYCQADESPIQVLNEKDRKNTQKSYMWVFKGGPPDKQSVVFKYHPTRAGFVAQDFLKGFKGYVQSDGYAGYNFVAADKYMYQLYCMAHARRKFMEVVKLTKKKGLAHEVIKMIKELYKIEREARKKGLNPDEIYALRQEKSKPIMDKLKVWLDEHIQTILPKSPTGKAMGYMLKHWEGLYRYLKSGYVEIDNNGIENMIRPLALGRKNYLFMGSPTGADAAANIYSLLATCKANNINPYKYFKKMLENIRYCETEDDYRQLLPQNIVL